MSEQKSNLLGWIGYAMNGIAVIYIFNGLLGWLPSNLASLLLAACIALLGLWLHFKAEGAEGIYYSWLSLFNSAIQVYSFIYLSGALFRCFPVHVDYIAAAGFLFLLSLLIDSKMKKRAQMMGYKQAQAQFSSSSDQTSNNH